MIYWLIHTSNKLSQYSIADETAPPAKITTPELTLSGILSLSKTIVGKVSPIPATIYSLFESVIEGRKAAYSFFSRIVTETADPKIEESNVRHKAFIDTLVEAFHALGGETWKKDHATAGGEVLEEEEEADDDDDIAFTNRYASLDTTYGGEKDEEEEEMDGEGETSQAKENKPPTRGRGKKGKKGKGKRKAAKGAKKLAQPEPSFQDVPLESYRIVDEQTTVTDYLLAVYTIIREMTSLRT